MIQQLQFPSEITASLLQPVIVLWSNSAKTVIIAEPIPWEEGMETAFDRKKEKYTLCIMHRSWLESVHKSAAEALLENCRNTS